MGWLVFVAVVACVPFFPDGAHGVRWAWLSVALPAVFLWTRQLQCTWGHLLSIAFTLWCALTGLWAPSTYQFLFVYWHIVLFCLAFLIAAENDFDMEVVFKAAGFALIINTLVVISQMAGYNFVPSATPPAGIFFNKGSSSAITALVVVGLLGYRQFLLAALIAPPLFVAPLSRAPLVALFAAGVVWLWGRHRLAAGLAAGLFVGVVAWLAADTARMASGEYRLALWGVVFKQLSWFGVGVGGFSWADPFSEYAHNDMLQVLYESGAPGLLLLGGAFLFCLWGRITPERLVLITFLVEGCLDFPFYLPATSFLAALVAGALCRGRPLVRELLPLR